ncbi:MAG: inositol monophosphatase family protein [Myxococcota bacterium]
MSPVQSAIEAAHAAGQIIREAVGDGICPPTLTADKKGAVDLVTRIDVACETRIREVLEAHHPGVAILGEEGGGAAGAQTRWIVDPIDGTTNFVHGFPSYSVSIALEEAGQLTAACIFDPVRDHTYTATRGAGAYCNGQRLSVSTQPALSDALLLTGFAYDRREKALFYLKFVRAFLEQSQGIRRAGSAAMDLAHIAAGRADGYWEFNLHAWDVAAGALLVAEAGGRVSAIGGGPLDLGAPHILATNGPIHDQMSAVIELLWEDGDLT